MRAYRRLSVRLSKRDREELRQLLRKGIQPVRTVLRALTLLQFGAGQTASEVASHVQLTPKAVRVSAGAATANFRYQPAQPASAAERARASTPSGAPQHGAGKL